MSEMYVLQVMSGKELFLAEIFKYAGIRAYVPREIVTERRKGEWTEFESVLFSGYLFVDVAMSAAMYQRIAHVDGVIRFLSFTNPLPDSEAKAIRAASGKVELTRARILPDKSIEIVSGFLKDFPHEITGYNRRNRRVTAKTTLGGEKITIKCSAEFITSEVNASDGRLAPALSTPST